MDWTKILDKGWLNVIQTVINIVVVVLLIIWISGAGKDTDESIREDIKSVREYLDTLDTENQNAVELTARILDSNERVAGGLDKLSTENRISREITTELGDANTIHTRRIRLVQDQYLRTELITDELQQLIKRVESENNYSRREE